MIQIKGWVLLINDIQSEWFLNLYFILGESLEAQIILLSVKSGIRLKYIYYVDLSLNVPTTGGR